MNLFNRKSSKAAQASDARNDGYTQYKARQCAKFQAIIESESGCDYDALRAALLQARDTNFAIDSDLCTLRAAYNDHLYANAEIAYSRR